MTIVSVATNAELMSALAGAVGGDRIELAPGIYGRAGFKNLAFASDVTVVSADPANPAEFQLFYVDNVSHLVLAGILFNYTFEAPWSIASAGEPIYYLPFSITNSSYITIRNSVFDGDVGLNYDFGWGVGLNINKGCDNIVVENNEFFTWYKAIASGQSSNLTMRSNDVHLINTDAFTFVSVNGILIEGNRFHDWFSDPDGHRDMVQFWTKINETSCQNVIIRGNFFDAGIGEQTQTIFLRNNIVDTSSGSFEGYAFRNFLIEDNVIYNANGHGITVGATDGLVVQNNTILFDAFAGGNHTFLAPQMRLVLESVNVIVQNNISHWDLQVAPGWTVTNELVVQITDYANLFVNALIPAPRLADLRAVAGGVVELGGYGAAMTRADIPILVGPYATTVEPDPVPDPVPEPGVCEALLAEALAVVADLEGQLAGVTIQLEFTAASLADADAALVAMMGERDVALASLAVMTALRGEAVAAGAAAETALALMTTERDAALLAQTTAEAALTIALSDLTAAVDKLAAILVIVS